MKLILKNKDFYTSCTVREGGITQQIYKYNNQLPAKRSKLHKSDFKPQLFQNSTTLHTLIVKFEVYICFKLRV